MTGGLYVQPLTLAQANDLVSRWHRHHKPVRGHRFSIGAYHDGEPCGAAIVGRPVGGGKDQYLIAEVTRLVTDGTFNACTLLYGATARAAKAMGFTRIQTFILVTEPGTSLRAAGWTYDRLSHPIGWTNGNRPRDMNVPGGGERKQLWYRQLHDRSYPPVGRVVA